MILEVADVSNIFFSILSNEKIGINSDLLSDDIIDDDK